MPSSFMQSVYWPDSARQLDSVPPFDVFNWTPDNTRRLYRSLSAATAGTGYSDHIVLGDGQSYYKTVSTSNTYWPGLMRSRLSSAGVPVGGAGWVRAGDGAGDVDSRVVKTGTWTTAATKTFIETSAAGAALTFTSDFAGTSASVAYHDTSAPFTVAVDGGTPVTVTPTGASSVGVYTVTGLSNANHVITLTTTTAAYVGVVGFQVFKASGLRVHNFAANNWGSYEFSRVAAFTDAGQTYKTLVPNPDVVHIALAQRDVQVNADSTALNVQTIRNLWPNADVILHLPLEYNPTLNTSGQSWVKAVKAIYEAGSVLNLPIVDVYRRTGGFVSATANGLMSGNYLPSALGSKAWDVQLGSAIDVAKNVPGLSASSAASGVTGSVSLSAAATNPVESVGAAGTYAVLSSANIGGLSNSMLVQPALYNELAFALRRGGTVTITKNGAPAVLGTDYTNTGSFLLDNLFDPSLSAAQLKPAAGSDVFVVEVDHSYAPIGTPTFYGVEFRAAQAAKNTLIEVWDVPTSAWVKVGECTENAAGTYGYYSNSSNSRTKVRYTFTNFVVATLCQINTLFAVTINKSGASDYLLPRTGGNLYGTTTTPPAMTASGATGTAINLDLSGQNTGVVRAGGTQVETKGHTHTVAQVTGAAQWVAVPASATAPGTAGQLAADAGGTFLYICVAANVWRRVAIAAW